jgi:hypothetical protein
MSRLAAKCLETTVNKRVLLLDKNEDIYAQRDQQIAMALDFA